MAYVTKKNVKWKLENIPVISSAEYVKDETPFSVAKSTTQNNSVLTSCVPTAVTHGQIQQGHTYTLPSLAPLIEQDNMEVRVLAVGGVPQPPHVANNVYGQREQDRKVRREIANSNERRRMQSINAGFKSLKAILPQTAGDKLSKAAILQQTADYIVQLDTDKTRLLSLNEKYRAVLSECKCDGSKRRALMYEGLEKDEGIGSPREEDLEDIRRDTIEVRLQLEKERRLRMQLEGKVRDLESQVCTRTRTVAEQPMHITVKPKVSTNGLLSRQATQAMERKPSTDLSESQTRAVCQQVSFTSPATGVASDYPQSLQSLATDVVPPAAVCVTVAQENPLHSPPIQTKTSGNLPRSRQPLKKRAIEIPDNDDISPRSKIQKTQTTPVPNTAARPSASSPPKAAVLFQRPFYNVSEPLSTAVPVTLHPSEANRVLDNRLLHPAGVINGSQGVPVADQPLLLSATSTYITLSPSVFTASPTTWQDQQAVVSTTPNYSIAAVPSANGPRSHFILQPAAMHKSYSNVEDTMLKQLNGVSPLSMTLTQLNALPHLNSTVVPPTGSTLPSARVQTQYLPVVAMDAVLCRQNGRRISSATTDSAASDEECRNEMATDKPIQCSNKGINVAPGKPGTDDRFVSSRTKSNLGLTRAVGKSSPVSTPCTLSVLSLGPGSPPMIRHKDATAVRPNLSLETIVQAIDHLEQQERRNSQDQQVQEV